MAIQKKDFVNLFFVKYKKYGFEVEAKALKKKQIFEENYKEALEHWKKLKVNK